MPTQSLAVRMSRWLLICSRGSLTWGFLGALLLGTSSLHAAVAGPVITTQPVATTVHDGQTATFTVVATGNPVPSYQWQLNGLDISGATAATYTTPATRLADSGNAYDVVVSNAVGAVTSNSVMLAVNSAALARNTANDANYISTIVYAEASLSPPTITLKWAYQPESLQYRIYRKLFSDTTWTLMTSFAATSTSLQWSDTTVNVGTAYEYRVERDANFRFNGSTSTRVWEDYACGGIDVPAVDSRGTVLLIVDNTLAGPLGFELARLQDDLVGDGWMVKRYNVARGIISGANPYPYDPVAVANVKSIIRTEYLGDPTGTRSVFLFGHVPVPYTGSFAWDGHTPNHSGAWAADIYYADMNGIWTDSTVNAATGLSYPENVNIPGDGKFDQDGATGTTLLEVGRVDLSNLPSLAPKSEIELMRQYLEKDHALRQGSNVFSRQAIVDDHFFLPQCASVAYTAMSPVFGGSNMSSGAITDLIGTQMFAGYYLSGGGSPNTCGSYFTRDWPAFNPKAEFIYLFGSWFGDWDKADDFERAALGTTYTMETVWSRDPVYLLHRMALGGSFGEAVKISEDVNTYLNNPLGHQAGADFMSLMGDPTLRFFYVLPPANLQIAMDGGNHSVLSWTASSDSPLLGYHVYRSVSSSGPFMRLTTSPVGATNYTDLGITSGNYYYQVKAVKLDATATGGSTYENLSQAISASYPPAAAGTIMFSAPTFIQNEGNSGTANAVITVNRVGGSAGAASVQYATSAGTATSGTDYTAASGTLIWAAGDASPKTFNVPVIGDSTVERDETVNLTLSSVTGASLAANMAQLVIANDDAPNPGTIEFSSATYIQAEGNSGITNVMVTLNRLSGFYGSVGVSVVLSDGTATAAGGDYVPTVLTVSWPNNQGGAKTVNVPICGDTMVEGNEFLNMTITAPTNGATLGRSQAQLIILNDDGAATGPNFITQPASATALVGYATTFSAVATGIPAPTYQWQKNGVPITGATAATYTTPAAVLSDNGAIFSVVATNASGSVASAAATLTVSAVALAPTIVNQPADTTVNSGQMATFSVAATGSYTLSYQWRKNGVNIVGAYGSSYTTPATIAADDGALYSVVVTNISGSKTSNNAKLTVNSSGLTAQVISGFTPFPAHMYGDAPIAIVGVGGGGSGNPVTFASSNTAVATVSGNMVTIAGAGSATITASQAGSAIFAAAADVPQVLTVTKAALGVTANAASRVFGATNPAFSGTVTGVVNGDPISASYASTANAATAAGSYGPATPEAITPTLLDPSNRLGNYTVTSSKATLTISQAAQNISGFTAFGAHIYGDLPITIVGVTGGASGTPVTFVSSNAAVATVSGATVTIVGAGTATITASQAGNANYTPASNVPQVLTVAKAPLSVTAAAASRAFGTSNPTFTGTLIGVVNGDPITATYASSASATTAVGIYGPTAPEAITPTLIDASGRLVHYTVTKTNGILTITTPAGPPTPAMPSISNASSTTPTIGGNTSPNATISVYIDGNLGGTAIADAAGNWTYTIAPPLVAGAHSLMVTATDSSGTSAPSPTLTLSTAPAPASSSAASGSDQGSGCGLGAGLSLMLFAIMFRRRRR